jgi:hypothetical protein
MTEHPPLNSSRTHPENYPGQAYEVSEIDLSVGIKLERCIDLDSLIQISHEGFLARERVLRVTLFQTKVADIGYNLNEIRSLLGSTRDRELISLKQVEYSLDALLGDILSSGQSTHRGLNGVEYPYAPLVRYVKIPKTWEAGCPVDFEVAGITYRVVPPSLSRPGELIEFNPAMMTLCVVNSKTTK